MATQRISQHLASTDHSAQHNQDWTVAIPSNRKTHLRRWLWTGAIITASTLFIGGVTRLTESGLSIVDWDPIVGAIPPITDLDWENAFDRYKQYPEYVKLRPNMTMSEFKFIYFWECLHRNVGRLLGLVFLIPFLFFLVRGYFNGPLLRRVLLLFTLGALQGLMGWYMVSSGLVDRPDVSHVRLAAHLSLAVIIFSCCLWFANDLLEREPAHITGRSRRLLRNAIVWIGALLGIQIFWGGLVAGLKAGLNFSTFPLMAGRWVPPSAWKMEPVLINLIDNVGTVQWMHRLLATALLIAALGLAAFVWRNADLAPFRWWSMALMLVIVLQYSLGIITLLTHVLTEWAVTHQFVALVAVGVLLTFLHRVLHSKVVDGGEAPGHV